MTYGTQAQADSQGAEIGKTLLVSGLVGVM